MLRKGPAYPQYARRNSRDSSWEQEDVSAAAYDDGKEAEDEDEEVSRAYDAEDEGASNSEEYAAPASDDLYPSDFEEEDAYAEEDAGDTEDDESSAPDEEHWDADAEGEDIADEHALAPLDERQVFVFQEPDTTAPIFIAGRGKTAPPGALGHSPLALRARRPRPFFMHAFAVGMVVLSLLVTAFAFAPTSTKEDVLNVFTNLAGFAAPPAQLNIPFHWYDVHYGDTLQAIARRFNVQQGGILELNQLVSADQLYPSMQIKIPTSHSYGSDFHALLNLPLAPLTVPPPPYGNYIAPPGFTSFPVYDYYGDPWAGSFGQCTWWAHHKRPDEDLEGMGDAWNWVNAARAKGMLVTTTPLPNSTVVFEPGVEGALGVGHVAHVEQILSGGWVLISEMNFFWNGGGFARVDYRYITPGPGVWFIA
jgi:LysM repeat protein